MKVFPVAMSLIARLLNCFIYFLNIDLKAPLQQPFGHLASRHPFRNLQVRNPIFGLHSLFALYVPYYRLYIPARFLQIAIEQHVRIFEDEV